MCHLTQKLTQTTMNSDVPGWKIALAAQKHYITFGIRRLHLI